MFEEKNPSNVSDNEPIEAALTFTPPPNALKFNPTPGLNTVLINMPKAAAVNDVIKNRAIPFIPCLPSSLGLRLPERVKDPQEHTCAL